MRVSEDGLIIACEWGPAGQRFTAGGAALRQVKHHPSRSNLEIAKPTHSDEPQIASDQVRLVTALEQPIRVALLETDPLALKRRVGEIKRQVARAIHDRAGCAMGTSRLRPA